jgi:peptidyl-prolyl cis-trans isomerase D
MLKQLRNKKTAKKVWIFLAVIIVPAFILWGSGSMSRGKDQAQFAGKLFGRNVPFTELRDAIDAVRTQGIMQFGEKFPEVEKYMNLESQAWDRLILLAEAKKRRAKATDAEVIKLIESYSFFQRNGVFDQKIYSELLQYVFRIQPRAFEEQTRQNIMLSKLYDQITANITVKQEEIKDEYLKANQEISINYIAALPADFAKDIAPSDQEIKEYFSSNQLNFKQPLSYNLEYVTADSVDKIKEFASKLSKQTDFVKIAEEMKLEIKETGLFAQSEPIPQIGWSPEILNLISNLQVGEFSQGVHLDKSYYMFLMKEKKEAFIPEFDKIKDKVKDALIKERSAKLAREKIDQALDKLKEAKQADVSSEVFLKLAKELGIKSESSAPFKFGSYIEGVGASDNLWLAASALKEGESSSIISIPSGFYIIGLKSKPPIDELKFQAEKDELNKKLLSQKKQEFFAKFLEELKKKIQ